MGILGRYHFFPLILGTLSAIILVVSVVTEYWYIVTNSKEYQTNEGLWRICKPEKCQKFSGDISSWFQAVRAFLLMAILALIISFVFFFIALRFKKLKVVYPCGLFITSMLIIFSLTVYGIKKKTVAETQVQVQFGYSYIIGWASGTLCLVATVVALYAAKRQTPAATTTITKQASNVSLNR